MKKPGFLLFIIGWFSFSFAQTTIPGHDFTPEESGKMPVYLESVQLHAPTTLTPSGAVRTMAEWEEIEAVVITWTSYIETLTEIVRHAVQECRVIIIANSVAEVTTHLQAEGIPLDNVEVLVKGFNTIWIRDYGPWTVYKNDVDSLFIVDWIYNRPRPKDDVIPQTIAEYLDIPYFGAITPPFDWVHTGGNHLRDGMGTAFSSDLMFAENPGRDEATLDGVAGQFLGVNRYVKFRRLPYDGIHHIDMHMLIIDEETFLVGEYPEGVSDGPQIEANIKYLRNHFTTAFGNNYRVERLPMPPESGIYPSQNGAYRTYSNAIFINKTILVPVYEEQYDTTALRIYRENLPGYKVVGIDCNNIIQSLGALHCITKLVGVEDPLRIAHPRLRDTYVAAGNYPVEAIIQHRSGIAGATLYYRTAASGDYQSVVMAPAGQDKWVAGIPAFPPGTEVRYYIEATANNGKTQLRPQVAPEGYFRFRVLHPVKPTAGILFPGSTICPGQNLSFRDDSKGGVTHWNWSFPGGQPETSNLPNPVVFYPQAGVYDVMLTVSNAQGMDIRVMTGAVQVKTGQGPLVSDFTGGIAPEWTVINEDGDGTTWAPSENLQCGGQAVVMDNHGINTRFRRDYLRTRIDLSELADPELHFDVAYARRISRSDELRVNATSCEGNKSMVYDKTGDALATAPASNSAFIPAACNQWRTEIVDLGPYAGQTVEIEFENIGGYGNRLYLDNIRITGNFLPQVAISAPLNGEIIQLESLTPIHLSADASDPEGELAYVAFFVDGDSVGISAAAPYALEHLFPEFGDYVLTAKAVDAGGAVRWSAPVTLQIDQITGISSPDPGRFGFSLFPNPAAGNTQIYFHKTYNERVNARLSNSLGQVIQRYTWQIVDEKPVKLDLTGLANGLYWLSVENGSGVVSRQLIVSR